MNMNGMKVQQQIMRPRHMPVICEHEHNVSLTTAGSEPCSVECSVLCERPLQHAQVLQIAYRTMAPAPKFNVERW